MENTIQKLTDRGIKVNEVILADRIFDYHKKAEIEKGQSSMRRAKILQNIQASILEGRIHPNYRVTETSGRIQSFEPCTTNTPKDDHDIFALGAKLDYAQAQLRIAAIRSGESKLIEAFLRGEDPYQVIADDLGCTRNIAKVIALGPIFGMGAPGIAGRLRISRDDAQDILDKYEHKYWRLFRWVEEMCELFADSETLYTPYLDIKLTMPLTTTKKKYKDADPDFIEHMHQHSMVAAYLQGAESDMLKMTLQACEEEGIPVVNPRHDEIWLDIGVTEEQVTRAKEIMETVVYELDGIMKVTVKR